VCGCGAYVEPLPRKKKPAAKKDAGGGAKKPPTPKKAPVPTTSGTTEPPSMHVSQAPAAEPKGPAPPLSTTADERRTELGGDQVADASVQAQAGEEELVPPATTTEQVDTTTATATKRGGKKKTATKKERTLLPMSNNALQSRQQQVEVCKAIAREMFKHQTQNAAEADDDVDVYHRPTTQPTEKEAAEPSKALEPGAEAQPVASSPGPTKGHLQEVNLFMGDKEALDLLQAEGTPSPCASSTRVVYIFIYIFVCGQARRNRRAEIGRAPPCWPCGRATWAPRFVRRFRRTYVRPTPA
jgi:hypothetical protein